MKIARVSEVNIIHGRKKMIASEKRTWNTHACFHLSKSGEEKSRVICVCALVFVFSSAQTVLDVDEWPILWKLYKPKRWSNKSSVMGHSFQWEFFVSLLSTILLSNLTFLTITNKYGISKINWHICLEDIRSSKVKKLLKNNELCSATIDQKYGD
jgi:hypothetical protein